MKKNRSCLPCDACCLGHLELGITLQPKNSSDTCINCTSNGCAVYESRPVEPCRQFECLWLVFNSPLPVWMRPDQSRVIVTLNVLKESNRPVMVALQMDDFIPERTISWLREFGLKYQTAIAVVRKSAIQSLELSEHQHDLRFL